MKKLAALFYLGMIFIVLGLSCTETLLCISMFIIGSILLYNVCTRCSWEDLKIITGSKWIEKKTGIDLIGEEC